MFHLKKEHFLRNYVDKSITIIPRSKHDTGTVKKPSKLDNLKKAVNVFPYLFKHDASKQGFDRLSLDVVKVNFLVAQYGADALAGRIDYFPSVSETRELLSSAAGVDVYRDLSFTETDGNVTS